MHSLRVLAEVVEPGELLGAVAGEGAFACVFPEEVRELEMAYKGKNDRSGN